MLATVKQMPRAALASLALVAVLAGCGGGGSSATNSTTSAASPPTSGSAPTGSAATHTTATTPSTTAATPSSSSKAPPNPATYGHPAGASERAAVTRLVRGYYAALSAGHEAAACGMLATHIQQLLERSVRRTRLLHGKGCVGAFKLIFGHRGRTSAISPTVTVTGVRVQGDHGYALFSTQSIPSAQLRVERAHGSWKIGSLIGSPLAGTSSSNGG
jgi:hypothetical protein